MASLLKIMDWKKLALILIFFTITPITLTATVFGLIALSRSNSTNSPGTLSVLDSRQEGVLVFASLPTDVSSISGEVIPADARPVILRDYLEINESSLSPFANFIVEVADKYGLDYRLIVAIAQKESGLCRIIPYGSYNCWGWGIHSDGTLGFDSYEEGIETVSKGLKQYYIDLGYETVEQIQKKYAHPSSTTWAEGVLYYMSQMR